jgi:hypothetical protein
MAFYDEPGPLVVRAGSPDLVDPSVELGQVSWQAWCRRTSEAEWPQSEQMVHELQDLVCGDARR